MFDALNHCATASNHPKPKAPVGWFGALNKYSQHPSILKIIEFSENETVNSKRENKFCFKPTTYETVYNGIALLNPAKASLKDSIPAKIIKDNCDIFARNLHIDFNFSIGTCTSK